LETVVAVELKRRGAELAYALTPDGAEVDFAITNADGSKSLMQVAAELPERDTLTREFRPLQPGTKFMAPGWGKAPRLLLTLDMSTAIQAQSAAPPETTVRPVWAWLMADS
jgi:predicted AAA+ superfamily ATPase